MSNMIDVDDDDFLYGDSKDPSETPKTPVLTSVPQPISLEQARSATQGLVAHLEAEAAGATNDDTRESSEDAGEKANADSNADEEEGDGEDEEESDDDVEFIMEQPSRALDFRQQGQKPTGPRSSSFGASTKAPPSQPQPTLTTEYTPRDRGAITKLSTTPQPASTTPLPALSATPGSTANQRTEGEHQADSGPDPSTLPPTKAPPSHPSINPEVPGTLDGRSILEVDLSALAEKPWRRPGSDLSDWFNYGFDEISWEAYCYRRRELGEVAGVLKTNVLNFAGMPEEQLTALPPEIRTMVMASATAMMAGGGAGNGPGMMPPGGGMNMNGNPMLNQMMNMNPMMGPMMQDMGMGVGTGMDMGMGMGGGGPGMQMPGGGAMGGAGPGPGMMQDGGGPGVGVGVGGGPQGAGQGTPEGMGEGFGPGGPGAGQGMMGMGMGGEFGMQQDPSAMGQQMYPGMEASSNTPVQAPTPTRPTPSQPQFRGRGMPPQMPMRARGAYAGRGRTLPVRPASPLPPNVPTGPRNKNKYKDIDGSAPAVDGLDYGGGGSGMKEGSRATPDVDERNRKRRSSPGLDDSRSSKRR
ncbi:hypothetical protein WOLCODRAFT_135605 [Wolfiporia cocos MD-104 SS10]|uniref:Pre-mRNA polyadenylation factor Fip1 domain-containing protein n=1 Tax=Wolfiporia cocos (strain MD-104) TaxID=742152 RepID=A0A2H3IWB6_WOLCO|nr:hypothetical protein WOLCODRAFT_135605 [Wolfiporia cocos MD-104 SS10]